MEGSPGSSDSTAISFRDVGIQVSNLFEGSGDSALHSINKHFYHMTSEFGRNLGELLNRSDWEA